ncbi:cytochrome P450 [Mangrovihabitans endophyticus]|uniref:Cytochrome P450 n=1 Tax=Mangrovihabitans endophyticus TaxID=1751298 RepID=A0A8J3FNC1_9ACTN|nr:cytochrome P450 [Mangrovihabitans endophyticus]GGK80362.1 cytochrome P450 [Mangrovihabitans endophyticus]
MITAIGVAAGLLAAISVPRWLPPRVIRLREWIFTKVNGEEGVAVPGPMVGAEHFERVYGDPAADGRSRGAGLSDLFWYWLAPGPHMHQEHLEPGPAYQTVARTTRRVLAVAHHRSDALATAATRRVLDALPDGRVSHVRLRDLMLPVWAEVYYEMVFAEPCPAPARDLIVANAHDVITALKATGLRHMDRRDALTRYLLDRLAAGTCPVSLPEPFTARETAWYLQGAFFNTAVVQMSEAMAHVLLAVAQHPQVQQRLRAELDSDAAIDRVVDEALRVHPLFGIAHRISSADIVVDEHVTLPAGSVLLFNYLAFHRTGPAADGDFDPDRWRTLRRREAHFIPYGVTANRACPARGIAPVMMRAATREMLRRFTLASSVSHSRSLPSRGPVYLTPAGLPGPGRTRLRAMRLRDRWADVSRSLRQLVLGTWMVLEARRLRLCGTHFEQVHE